MSASSETSDRRIGDALRRHGQDQRGASSIEYIIVVGLVAIIAIAAFQTFGPAVAEKLQAETQGVDPRAD
jgi:Flp pilus assembly pilin Flp